ncbi:ALG1 mannosyltransferase, partial [Atractosteus spatula]|nr:ALG1 mannosyltransferase [Atractosteus spatula]
MAGAGSSVAGVLVLLVAVGFASGYCVTRLGSSWAVLPVIVVGCVLLIARRSRAGRARTNRSVCVLVLGDLGRSPRMQYHCISLSKHGYRVSFVGYLGTKPHSDVLASEKIKIVPISDLKGLTVGPRVLQYVTKVVLQSLQLLCVLLKIDTPAHVLLQNPPGLPSIAVTWLLCTVWGSSFIIDWHNYGYTIMALAHGEKHPIVQIAKWYERCFGRCSDYNLCVTNAMKEDLHRNWNIKATTLYDKPPLIFKEASLESKHSLFLKMAEDFPPFKPRAVRTGCSQTAELDLGGNGRRAPSAVTGAALNLNVVSSSPMQAQREGDGVDRTAFTELDPVTGTVTYAVGRPALLLSSTSWTEDEDFSVLLKALEEYEGFIKDGATLPSLVCVITGKGPQKQYYKNLIEGMHFKHVQICTPWLEAEDYPVLLGSADLGVCLHKSSSGLDLPMKVVDMFGCCLPVCAIRFQCLHELVKQGENGLIFQDSQELAEQLKTLLADFPGARGMLGTFRRTLRDCGLQRWDESWEQTVLPLLSGDVQ